MLIKLTTIFLFILISYSNIFAQLVGNVFDAKGEPLSFATVYVKNTTLGTTTNIDGDYEFSLSPGSYDIIFQYVGFEQKIEKVTISNVPLRLDVQLNEESVGLTEVVVTADGEDPAYAIIRKAMAKRKFYLNQIDEYSCKAYTKGNQRVADVPKKIMGIDIGDMGGILDTTGNGIVYLSESVSNLYFKAPNQYKEEMISSKVSGDDNGFSFNQASALGFNFYENTYDGLGKGIISPIANNAFTYYKYRLEGAFVDGSGRLVNKIKVFRKRDTDPSLAGYIYINEDLWNIHSVDMWTDGKALAVSILDSIYIKQVNIPVKEPDVWKVFSTNLSFKLKIFGIKLDGLFTGVYTDYNLKPDLDPKFFNTSELLSVEEGANEKDSTYWTAIRPIPLTEEEIFDYKKKDSLQVVWKSEEFLDSVDRVSNKFKIMKLFTGYTYFKSYKKWSISVASPITSISFNAVQGYYTRLKTTFHKDLDEKGYRFLDVKGNVLYGFSDKQLRGTLGIDYNLNKTNYTNVGISGGRMTSQFNDFEPISVLANTYQNLLFKLNDIKIYDKYFAKVRASSELFNGFSVNGYLEYADRSSLVNTTNYSWFYKDSKDYISNNPLDKQAFGEPSFTRHQAMTIGFDIRIRFKQEYLSYPNRKFITGSKYPELHIEYRRGLPILGGDTDYDFLSLAIKDDIQLGAAGVSSFNLEGGMFLSDKAVPFIDAHHFNGKETIFMLTSRSLDQFRMLDYYTHSTTLPYVKLQWEHHFNGVILGKIPGVRKLQWELVAGSNVLYSDNTKTYSEVIVGINKIGYGLFKILRVDFVTQLQQGMDKPAYRVMIGINF
jgi:hypothetical protein